MAGAEIESRNLTGEEENPDRPRPHQWGDGGTQMTKGSVTV